MSALPLDKVQVFRCPNCQEFINTSMTECGFCHTAVDATASQAAADVQDKVASACSTANYLKILARAMPFFYAVSWIPVVGGFGGLGFLVLCFVVPGMFLYWWLSFAKLHTTDPDYPIAKKATLIAIAIWAAMVVLWFVVSVIYAIVVVSQNMR